MTDRLGQRVVLLGSVWVHEQHHAFADRPAQLAARLVALGGPEQLQIDSLRDHPVSPLAGAREHPLHLLGLGDSCGGDACQLPKHRCFEPRALAQAVDRSSECQQIAAEVGDDQRRAQLEAGDDSRMAVVRVHDVVGAAAIERRDTRRSREIGGARGVAGNRHNVDLDPERAQRLRLVEHRDAVPGAPLVRPAVRDE